MTFTRVITSLLCLLVAIEGHNYNYPSVIDGGTTWHHTGLLVTAAGTRPFPTSHMNLPHPISYATSGSHLSSLYPLPYSPLNPLTSLPGLPSIAQTANIVGSNPSIVPGSLVNLPGAAPLGSPAIATLNTFTGSTVPGTLPASLAILNNAGPGYASSTLGPLTSPGTQINALTSSPGLRTSPASLAILNTAGPGYASNTLGPLTSAGTPINALTSSPGLRTSPASLAILNTAGPGYTSNTLGPLPSLGMSINTLTGSAGLGPSPGPVVLGPSPGSAVLGPSPSPASLAIINNAGPGYATNALGPLTSPGGVPINTGSAVLGISSGPASPGLLPNVGTGYASNTLGSLTSIGSSTINSLTGSPVIGPSPGPTSLGILPDVGSGYASNALGSMTSLGRSAINNLPGSPVIGPSPGSASLGLLPNVGPSFTSNTVRSLTSSVGSLTNSAARGNLLGTTGSSLSRSSVPNFAGQSYLQNSRSNSLSINSNLPISSGSLNVATQNAISIPPPLTQPVLPPFQPEIFPPQIPSLPALGSSITSGSGYPHLPSPVSYPPLLPPNLLNGGSTSVAGATPGLLLSNGGLSLPSDSASVSSGSLNALPIPLAGPSNQNFETASSLLNSGISRASLSGSNLYGSSPHLNYASQYYSSQQSPAGTRSYFSYREGPQYQHQYLDFPLGSASSVLQGGSRTTLGSYQLNRPDWITPYSQPVARSY